MQYTRYTRVLIFILSLLYAPVGAGAQQASQNSRSSLGVQMDAGADIANLIGLTLEELYTRFGSPQAVYAVRGLEPWQDDVVFMYPDRDFYIYKNRVWQIEVKTAFGVKIGDPLTAVTRILGNGMTQFEDYLLLPLPSRAWPLMLRINLDQNQAVSALFVYRSDF